MTASTTFETAEGNHLQLTCYGLDLADDAPCIIYLHGFKGFKDWGFAPPSGEFFAAKGMRFLAMNFSHNGIGSDLLNFTEEKKFEDNTFSLELSEARQVVTAYANGDLFGGKGSRLGLLGHSRGGGIALLAGQGLPVLSAVCTWAAVSTFRRYPEEIIDQWRRQGRLEVKNARTGQVMYLGWQLHADLMDKIDDELNIEKAARNIGKPLCVIQGMDDPVVLASDANNIQSWAGPNCEDFHLISGAGHTFNARHPWDGSNPQLDAVWKHSFEFFNHQLNA